MVNTKDIKTKKRPSVPLAEEMAYFEKHKEEWLKDPEYSGRYVAIKGQEVICVKDTEEEIIEEVYGKGAVIKERFVKGSEVGDALITRIERETPKIFIYTTWTRDE